MADPQKFKTNIKNILIQESYISFLGDDFDQIVLNLSEKQTEKIYAWLLKVVKKEIQPITVGSPKPYKSWKMHELLIFRYPFILKMNEYRILLVKVKNIIYIEFHMGNHKYYDKIRKELSLKQSSS